MRNKADGSQRVYALYGGVASEKQGTRADEKNRKTINAKHNKDNNKRQLEQK